MENKKDFVFRFVYLRVLCGEWESKTDYKMTLEPVNLPFRIKPGKQADTRIDLQKVCLFIIEHPIPTLTEVVVRTFREETCQIY